MSQRKSLYIDEFSLARLFTREAIRTALAKIEEAIVAKHITPEQADKLRDNLHEQGKVEALEAAGAVAEALRPAFPVQWVVRAATREYSTSPSVVLFQLTARPADAYRFERYEDASAHARHLKFVYRQPFKAIARVRASVAE